MNLYFLCWKIAKLPWTSIGHYCVDFGWIIAKLFLAPLLPIKTWSMNLPVCVGRERVFRILLKVGQIWSNVTFRWFLSYFKAGLSLLVCFWQERRYSLMSIHRKWSILTNPFIQNAIKNFLTLNPYMKIFWGRKLITDHRIYI